MRKIPTYFERDWSGDRSRVVNAVNKSCEWVAAGEGIATRKIDGMCCAIRNGAFFKRRELKEGQAEPDGFTLVDTDDTTGKRVGWMPVGDGPEDRYLREAFVLGMPDGTYEFVGPKSQGGVEAAYGSHTLVRHDEGLALDDQPPRDFDGLHAWMTGKDIEGVVWHHPDGRMAKLKLRDFGLKRGRQ